MAKHEALSKREQISIALDSVQMHQESFWTALRELETVLGIELDSTIDYNDLSVADVSKMARKVRK